jgi:hypothetical protein
MNGLNAASRLSTNDAREFKFYIGPSRGFTCPLRKQCLHRTQSVFFELLLEGPYGHSFCAQPYDTLGLVAGGSGIAGVLPYLKRHGKK